MTAGPAPSKVYKIHLSALLRALTLENGKGKPLSAQFPPQIVYPQFPFLNDTWSCGIHGEFRCSSSEETLAMWRDSAVSHRQFGVSGPFIWLRTWHNITHLLGKQWITNMIFFQNFHSIWAVSLLVVYTSLWMILLKLFINKEQRQASFRNGDLKHKLTTGFQHNTEVSWRSFKFWMLNEITHFLTQHAALCYTNSNVIDGNVFFSRY